MMLEKYDGIKQYIYQVKSGIDLQVGEIVQLAIENNKIVADRSDGTAPLGFITQVYDDGNIFVDFRRNILVTDMFETAEMYLLNANLYVYNGLLTTRRHSAIHPAVAMVIHPPTAIDCSLRCLWL